MWFSGIVMLILIAYVVFRLSFTVRSIRARRRGDTDSADQLTQSGVKLFLAFGFGTLLVAVLAFVVITLLR